MSVRISRDRNGHFVRSMAESAMESQMGGVIRVECIVLYVTSESLDSSIHTCGAPLGKLEESSVLRADELI